MERIGSMLGQAKKRDNATERGELMKFFMERLNPGRVKDGYPKLTMARMGRILQVIPTKDLYFLKSVCLDAESKSKLKNAFSKKFWWEINPKKHEKETNKND